MNLESIATRTVVTIPSDATIQQAAKLMRDQHVGDVVVVSSEPGSQTPIGILTDRDIVLSTVAFGLVPDEVKVADVMTDTLATARTTDDVYEALTLMKQQGIKRLPVITPEGKLAGIVSAQDMMALLANELGNVVKISEKQHRVEQQRRKRFT